MKKFVTIMGAVILACASITMSLPAATSSTVSLTDGASVSSLDVQNVAFSTNYLFAKSSNTWVFVPLSQYSGPVTFTLAGTVTNVNGGAAGNTNNLTAYWINTPIATRLPTNSDACLIPTNTLNLSLRTVSATADANWTNQFVSTNIDYSGLGWDGAWFKLQNTSSNDVQVQLFVRGKQWFFKQR